jgi:hypothetical protein
MPFLLKGEFMKCFKIIPDYNTKTGKGLNPCIESKIENLSIWFEDAEPGEKFLIQVIEMTESQYNTLPEYMGP